MADELTQNIVVIGDTPTCTGFRLAGVQSVYPVEGKDASEILDGLLSMNEVGIIIINEKILGQMGNQMKKKLEKIAKPVIIAVPDKDGPMEQADSLKNMVKKALGFELIK